MIFNYAQPVAGLESGMAYRIVSTEYLHDDDCLAGSSALVGAFSHDVVPMDPSKEWKIPRKPWGYGDDNRNTPKEVGPFTFPDRLKKWGRVGTRDGSRILPECRAHPSRINGPSVSSSRDTMDWCRRISTVYQCRTLLSACLGRSDQLFCL